MSAPELVPAELRPRLAELAQELREKLAAEQPADVVVKEESLIHSSIAGAFSTVMKVKEAASLLSIDLPVSIPSGPEYLSGFATTIGSSIAMPREWHGPEHGYTRLLVLPHEWQHVKQHRDGVDAGWWPKVTTHSVLYLAGVVAKTEAGAEYVGKVEADGYAVTEFVRWWFTGSTRPAADVAASLRHHYNLVTGGSTVAEALLLSHLREVERGEAPNVWAARIAEELLTKRAADLRGSLRG